MKFTTVISIEQALLRPVDAVQFDQDLRWVQVNTADVSFAQTDDTSRKGNLGVIVMPTEEGAQFVIRQLRSGTDFAVLAKEKSVAPSAIDGGYLGRLAPGQLRPELRMPAQKLPMDL